MLKKALIKGLVASALFGCFSVVHADSITYSLVDANTSGYTGPYGSVTVNLTSSTTARVTFTASSPYSMVDGGSADLNVNGTSSIDTNPYDAITDPNGMQWSNSQEAFKGLSSGTISTFGDFNQQIDFKDAAHPNQSISFTLTKSSGTWSDAANVLVHNADNYEVAAHILFSSAGNGVTGYAAGGPTSGPGGGQSTPLPKSAWAALPLLGLAALRRKSARVC